MGLWSGRSVAVTSSYPFSQHKHDRLTNVKENLARRRMKHRVVMRALVAEAESEKRRRPPAVPRPGWPGHGLSDSESQSERGADGGGQTWLALQQRVMASLALIRPISPGPPPRSSGTGHAGVRGRQWSRGKLAVSGCPQQCMPGRGRASAVPRAVAAPTGDLLAQGDGQAGTANLVAIQPTSRGPSTPVLGDPSTGRSAEAHPRLSARRSKFSHHSFRIAGSNDTAALLSRRLLIHRPRQPLCPSLPSRHNNSPDQAHPGLPHIFSPSADIPRPSSDQDSSPATFLVHPSLQPKALVSNRNNGSTDDTLQGAKAQQKRDRNQKDTKVAKSQTKVNQKALTIQCQVCKATFLQTTKAPALLEHASNKHNKGLADCFPGAGQ
ncbi:uncharacterized protein PCL_10341 [Purpureocillium lilacinum]|uniref:At2g23090-like zinc-binding domain-containing protein n=1 Tax=Purpureocillium lilacinum TaxID=33203 RepID=A0A2U3EFN3_PURLI|nr:uncharacterized protein PCL_10341 [Purpureocillium lilacinum]